MVGNDPIRSWREREREREREAQNGIGGAFERETTSGVRRDEPMTRAEGIGCQEGGASGSACGCGHALQWALQSGDDPDADPRKRPGGRGRHGRRARHVCPHCCCNLLKARQSANLPSSSTTGVGPARDRFFGSSKLPVKIQHERERGIQRSQCRRDQQVAVATPGDASLC